MSEKESVLKKYTDLRDDLETGSSRLSLRYIIDIYNIKGSIEELNESLSLDDNDFIEDLYNISYLVDVIKDKVIIYLQGYFTQSFFERNYGKYIEDEQIDPVIRNKLKEIGNKVIENEKDPLIQRFNNALENFEIKRDILYDYIESIEEIDRKLIKYFLEHE